MGPSKGEQTQAGFDFGTLAAVGRVQKGKVDLWRKEEVTASLGEIFHIILLLLISLVGCGSWEGWRKIKPCTPQIGLVVPVSEEGCTVLQATLQEVAG